MKNLFVFVVSVCLLALDVHGAASLLGVTNTGGGISLIQNSNAPVPIFKSLTNGSNVTIIDNGTNVVISSSGGGSSGPTNTFNGNQFSTIGGTNISIKLGALETNVALSGGSTVTSTTFTNNGTVLFPLLSTNKLLGLNSSGAVVSSDIAPAGTNYQFETMQFSITGSTNVTIKNGASITNTTVSGTSTITNLITGKLYNVGNSGVQMVWSNGPPIIQAPHSSIYWDTNVANSKPFPYVMSNATWYYMDSISTNLVVLQLGPGTNLTLIGGQFGSGTTFTNNGTLKMPGLTTNTYLGLDTSFNVISIPINSGASGTNYYFNSQFTILSSTNVTLKNGILVTNLNALGSGVNSISLGTNTTASATDSIAIGDSATTPGSGSISIGTSANSGTSGSHNIAIGYGPSITSSSTSVVIGDSASATSAGFSIVIGRLASVDTGSDDIAIGRAAGSVASGGNNVTLGHNSSANSVSSATAIGSSSSAGFNSSTALGVGATTTVANQVRIGTSSETVSVPGTMEVVGVFTNSNLTASQLVMSSSTKTLSSVTIAGSASLSGNTLTVGTVGTMINTTTPLANAIPVFNGTDPTNMVPSKVTISASTNLLTGTLTVTNTATVSQLNSVGGIAAANSFQISVGTGGSIGFGGNGTGSAASGPQVKMNPDFVKIQWFNNGLTASGPLTFGLASSVQTANYTVLATEAGTVFNNSGASGAITFTLPAAVTNLHYYFVVATAQILNVTSAGSDVIRWGSTLSGAAGTISSSTIGHAIHIHCMKAGVWVVDTATEAWTLVAARRGDAALTGGTVTVANTTVTANTIVLLSRKTAGGTLGAGGYSYSVSAGTSFTINSVDLTGVLSTLDTSTISWSLQEKP